MGRSKYEQQVISSSEGDQSRPASLLVSERKTMSTETQLDVLAIFSHPDDAELTMAGTLLKLKSLGYRIGVLDMTRGEMATRGTPEIRAKEALEAARVMGLDARLNLEQPDGHLAADEE